MTKNAANGLLALMFAAILSSCANRGEFVAHSQPLDANALDAGSAIITAAVAESPSDIGAASETSQWWQIYGDPQLDGLIEIASAENPDLHIAADRIAQAQALAGGAAASLWPKLDADAKLNRVHASKLGETPPPYNGELFWDNNIDLGLSYELDLWGKNRSGWQAAIGALRAAQVDGSEARLSLQTSLVRTYIRLSLAYALRDVLADTLAQQQQVLDITRRRYQVGLLSSLQVSQAEAQVAPVRVRLEQADNTLSILRNQLAALSGQGPGAGEALVRPVLLSQMDKAVLPSVVPAELIARRPDIVAARWRVEASAKNIDVAVAQFYPNIKLSLFAGLQALSFDKLFGGDAATYGYGPAITLPIFEGGRLRANLAGRTADYDLAVDRYNAAVIQALQQVADQIAAVQSGARQRQAAQTALDAAQKAYDEALIGFRAGLTDYLTVLATQTGLLAQRQTLAQIAASQLDAHAGLMQALGGGFVDTTNSAEVLQQAAAKHPLADPVANAVDDAIADPMSHAGIKASNPSATTLTKPGSEATP
jgi:NodT family efflux transporter outer membrane factor (OMF) lipoprotein